MASVGHAVGGGDDGDALGRTDGRSVGPCVEGVQDGTWVAVVGPDVGESVGSDVTAMDGGDVGDIVGSNVPSVADGLEECSDVGSNVAMVGSDVALVVGIKVSNGRDGAGLLNSVGRRDSTAEGLDDGAHVRSVR